MNCAVMGSICSVITVSGSVSVRCERSVLGAFTPAFDTARSSRPVAAEASIVCATSAGTTATRPISTPPRYTTTPMSPSMSRRTTPSAPRSCFATLRKTAPPKSSIA